MPAEQREGAGDVVCAHRRDVAADQDHRAGRQGRERTLHAPAEIALPLGSHPQALPRRIAQRGVGGDEQPDRPARIVCQRPELIAKHAAIEPGRLDRADLPGEAAFDAPHPGRPREDHQMTIHRP